MQRLIIRAIRALQVIILFNHIAVLQPLQFFKEQYVKRNAILVIFQIPTLVLV